MILKMLSVTCQAISERPMNGSESTRFQMASPRTNLPSVVNARTRNTPRRSSASVAMLGNVWSLASSSVAISTWPMSQIRPHQTAWTHLRLQRSHRDRTFHPRQLTEALTNGSLSLVRPSEPKHLEPLTDFIQELEQPRLITSSEVDGESTRCKTCVTEGSDRQKHFKCIANRSR